MILFDQNPVQAGSFFFSLTEAMIPYHSIETLDSSVGVRRRSRIIWKKEKKEEAIQSQAKDDRRIRIAAVQNRTWSLPEMWYVGVNDNF